MAHADQEVRRLLGKGIHHYGLIEDGDRIAVAVSGGKDSMLLLWLLRERLRRVPISYELVAVHVDPGFDNETSDSLESYFIREGFRYEIIKTDYGVRAHGPENRENPCFLCARLRRSALFKKAGELGCSKLAMGHNQDDMIETFFLNICYGAQVAGMSFSEANWSSSGHLRWCLPEVSLRFAGTKISLSSLQPVHRHRRAGDLK
jgi:tRNA 2-thiocytidine biosynthesis protein TtcA